MAFVNREAELGALEKLYAAPGFQFVPIYGRRRVGKTRLVREFIKGRDAVYHLSQAVTDAEQLKGLGRTVGGHFGDAILSDAGFRRWDQFFEYVGSRSGKRLAVVIDEFPYLCYSNPGVSSIFQKGIDERLSGTNVFLVLLGSSIGMMEKEVLHYKAPLYGRRTASLEVREMSFDALRGFFPRAGFCDLVRLFSVFGTIPAYVEKVDADKNLASNIRDLVLEPTSYLRNEVEFILLEELREPRNYFVILRAIAQGKKRVSEIVNDTGLDKGLVSRYLDILMNLRFVQKDVPVTEKNPEKSKLGIYSIRDKFVAFWFKYVFTNRSRLEIGDTEYVMRLVKDDLDNHVSFAFEDTCRDICARLMREGVLSYTRIGRWWSRDAEIDLVALDENEGIAWFGECKWSRRKVGEDIYRDLQRKSVMVDWKVGSRTDRFVLFSRSGFTDGMLRIGKEQNCVLVDGGNVVTGS